MANGKSRNKGARHERAVAGWLRENGYPNAHRRERGTRSTKDMGDIGGVPFVVECKDETGTAGLKGFYTNLLRYIDQLEAEMEVESKGLGLVVVKRPGRSDVGDCIVAMPADVWLGFLRWAYKAASEDAAIELLGG